MSRLGIKPIEIPSGVTVEIHGTEVVVKGPKNQLKINARPEIGVKVENQKVITEVVKAGKDASALWGTTRSLIANMIEGVSKGFEKKLELIGVGYRVKQAGEHGVILSVGFSHPVDFKAPEGVSLEVGENQTIMVKGADKQLVGQTAALIRKVRKPEPYKGKGIKYAEEVVRRKAGKTGKTGTK